MNTFFPFPRLLLAGFLTLGTACLHAEEKELKNEKLGALVLGQASAEVTKTLGQAEGKGKDTEWGATGEWVQEWRFPGHGLKLNMASEKQGDAKTLLSITAKAPCTLATSRGIQIGSSEAEVRKAYADVLNKEESKAGESLVAGSIYGGAIFTLKKGKVVEIFIGAAAE